MESFLNIDLLSVAIAIAGMCILGFIVFFNDRTSISNKSFLFLSLSASIWSIVNYLSYQSASTHITLWLLRFILFFAVWYTFALFNFFYVFPEKNIAWARWYKYILIPVVVAIDLFTLSPFTFESIQKTGGVGVVATAQPGFGIILFGLLIITLVISAFIIFAKKIFSIEKSKRMAYQLILIGAIITFSLHIIFNYLLPVIFNRPDFLPLGALFIFPLIALSAYAIIRHHLLNIKTFAAEALTFILAVTTFTEVIFAKTIGSIIFQSIIFLLILFFGILLIQSVQREVEQREELQRLNEKIEANNKQLEELGRFKSELLSLASHQIRSPLAAMKGFITLILGGTYGPVNKKVKETLGKVQASADDLIGLINTLLDVRKVEEGKMEYQFEKVDLTQLIATTVELLMPLAQAKNLSLTADLDKTAVFVNIDKEKFKQVIQNLIDNAIKYTPAGFVNVSLRKENDMALIMVNDSGLGIPETLIPYLFQEFIRDERVKKEIRGTGLGLYIARKITEAHGGSISAESPGEGKGSTFNIRIPVAR